MKNVYGNRCLITGAGSGVGKACAILFAQNGFEVVGVSRSVSEGTKHYPGGGSLTLRKMDVTDEISMIDGVNGIIDTEGRIDVLINNAGYGYMGAIENVSIAEAKRQLEVNLFGLARLTQLVLPFMRKQHS